MTETATGVENQQSRFETGDGHSIFYQTWRDPAAPPKRLVVLVHGFADHSGRFSFLVPDLVAHGAVVYAYDQRGQGQSSGQRGHVMSYTELVDEFDAFLKLAKQKEPGLETVVYAHSTGAILAMTYAFDHPEAMDRLVLSAPCMILAYEAPAWKTVIGKLMAGIAPKVTLKAGFDVATVSRDPEVIAATKADALTGQEMSTRFYSEVYLKAMTSALARIEELKVPHLVVHGLDDRLVSPKSTDAIEARSTAPHQVVRYPGGYHELHNDLDRQKLFADVEAWLETPVATSVT